MGPIPTGGMATFCTVGKTTAQSPMTLLVCACQPRLQDSWPHQPVGAVALPEVALLPMVLGCPGLQPAQLGQAHMVPPPHVHGPSIDGAASIV